MQCVARGSRCNDVMAYVRTSYLCWILLAIQTHLLLLTDGGFLGRHVFIVLVIARKADGVDMVRMISRGLQHEMTSSIDHEDLSNAGNEIPRVKNR